jgi:predicted esterase
MTYTDSYQLYIDVDRLVNEGQIAGALEALTVGMKELPSADLERHFSFFMDVKTNIYSSSERYEESLDAAEKMIDRGISCAPRIFEKAAICNDERAVRLKNRNNDLLSELKKNSKLEYRVYLPEGYTDKNKYPVFFALHQGGDNMDILNWYWKPDVFLKRNFIFVYVQSSWAMRSGRFQWLEDIEKAREDIKECYDRITGQYSINKDCVLIGGFSCGAICAMDVTFSDTIPVKGFISVSPYDKPESLNKTAVSNASKRGVRGAIIVGESELPVEAQESMLRIFEDNSLPCPYYINKGVVYHNSDELSKAFEKALEALL